MQWRSQKFFLWGGPKILGEFFSKKTLINWKNFPSKGVRTPLDPPLAIPLHAHMYRVSVSKLLFLYLIYLSKFHEYEHHENCCFEMLMKSDWNLLNTWLNLKFISLLCLILFSFLNTDSYFSLLVFADFYRCSSVSWFVWCWWNVWVNRNMNSLILFFSGYFT